jgi:glycosyltransferase involved in cell wall biosynthesis
VRILIITPGQPRTTGNWGLANRLQKGLKNLGHTVKIFESNEPSGQLERLTEEFVPDVINLLHAYRSGKPWLACHRSRHIPLIVTMTGTDINHGLADPVQKSVILRILAKAKAIITINTFAKDILARVFPELSPKLHHVPPAIDLGRSPFHLLEQCNIPPRKVLFLHPAGIRPVKGNLELLEMFEAVIPQHLCHLLFCGPLLDGDYAKRFLTLLRKCPWADYAGEIPSDAMPAAMRAADVILNNSVSEGFSNALQEAACLGVPILARNIPGNTAAFAPGRNGLLFDTPGDFVQQAVHLAKHPEVRRRLSQPTPSPRSLVEEARHMENIYRSLIINCDPCYPR